LRKSHKRRSKSKKRFILTLSIIGLLAISALSVALVYVLSNGDNNEQPPTDNTINPTISPSLTPFPSPSYQAKILNKQIPPGYVMGFPVDAGLMHGMNVIFIRNSYEKVSIRFTAEQSGTATKLVIYGYASQGQPTVRVGLQEDNGGNPKGQWIGDNAFGNVELSSSSGFKTVQLQTAASITEGQIYHIVVEAPESSLGGAAAIITYQGNGAAQPFNPDDPDIVWSDQRMNTLSYDGNNWQEQNKWPIFVVEYSDDTLEGQPYSISAPWVIYDSTYVGQTIIPASDYEVGKIAFDVSVKASAPQDKLYYQIRDINNDILTDGQFAQPSQLTALQTWTEVTLPTPVTFKAGQLYRVVLLSPQTDLATAYHVYGHEFCYNPLIGYGSLQHQLTSSYDGGATWIENDDADAIFKLTTTS
jgi:hypothetical protein